MSNEFIELRSDTFTRPSQEMRKVIAEAEVGDDVFGEDPSINELQKMAAEIFGKEEALYVPSGTMANQLSLKSHTQPGDEVIVEESAHVYNYEGGGPAFVSGLVIRALKGKRGAFTVDQVAGRMRPKQPHFAPVTLICFENSHNYAGGAVFPLENLKEISGFARKNNIRTHLDGARIFNASIASGVPVKEYAKQVDSLSFCLSKGLGAPVGSLILGTGEFMEKAHKYRKILGGGMRQAGILAAAGIYALKNNIDRLKEDHDKAKKLAQAIEEIDGFSICYDGIVETNIFIFEINRPDLTNQKVVDVLNDNGVRVLTAGPGKIRAVTHLDVSHEEIDTAIGIMQKAFK